MKRLYGGDCQHCMVLHGAAPGSPNAEIRLPGRLTLGPEVPPVCRQLGVRVLLVSEIVNRRPIVTRISDCGRNSFNILRRRSASKRSAWSQVGLLAQFADDVSNYRSKALYTESANSPRSSSTVINLSSEWK
jgi:hypothetical protein